MHLRNPYRVILFLMALSCLAACEGDYEITFRFTGLDAQHAENTGSEPALSGADTIPANAYVLRMYLFPEELSRKGRYLDPETPPSNVNPVKRFEITSDQDFDAQHPRDSSLVDLFERYDGTYFHITEGINYFFSNEYSPDFYAHPEPEYVDLLLMSPPTLSRMHRFAVTLTLRDSTIFTDTLPAIYLSVP